MKKLLFSIMILSFVACKMETGTDESSRFQVFNYADTQVSFAVIRDRVLRPQCLQCHSWSIDETEVNKRILPGNPEGSELYRMVKNGQMPSGSPRLSDQSLKLVEQYIVHLSKSKVEAPIPLSATYSSLKVNLFEKSCIRCHNPDVLAKHPKRPLLTSKKAIIDRYDDILYSVTDAWTMNDNEMPPASSDVPRVSEEVVKMLKEWKDSGFVD